MSYPNHLTFYFYDLEIVLTEWCRSFCTCYSSGLSLSLSLRPEDAVTATRVVPSSGCAVVGREGESHACVADEKQS